MGLGVAVIITVFLYAVFILTSLAARVKLKSGGDTVKSEQNGKTVAAVLYEKFGLQPTIKEKTDDKQQDTENTNDNVDAGTDDVLREEQEGSRKYESSSESLLSGGIKKDFKFENIDDTITDTAENEELNIQIDPSAIEITEDVDKYDINEKHNSVVLSETVAGSKNVVSVAKSAWVVSKLYCEQNKGFLFSFLHFISLLPRLIIQCSWILVCSWLFQISRYSETFGLVFTIITVASFAIVGLNYFYKSHIADTAMENLLECEIISEDEAIETYGFVRAIAIDETARVFTFLSWFVRKFLGYKI